MAAVLSSAAPCRHCRCCVLLTRLQVQRKMWEPIVWVNKARVSAGLYPSAVEAARAFDRLLLKLRGRDAVRCVYPRVAWMQLGSRFRRILPGLHCKSTQLLSTILAPAVAKWPTRCISRHASVGCAPRWICTLSQVTADPLARFLAWVQLALA